jgi:hypothetical protein
VLTYCGPSTGIRTYGTHAQSGTREVSLSTWHSLLSKFSTPTNLDILWRIYRLYAVYIYISQNEKVYIIIIDWLIITGWDYVSELLSLTDLLFIPKMIWVCRTTVEWYWQWKTEELGEKPVPMPYCPHMIIITTKWCCDWIIVSIETEAARSY